MDEPVIAPKTDLRTMAIIVYICWAVGFLTHMFPFIGIVPLVGVVLAFLKQKDAVGTMYESHFIWVVRTFLISLVVGLVAVMLMFVPLINVLSVLAFLTLMVWGLYRLVKGVLRFYENKPIENPKAFI